MNIIRYSFLSILTVMVLFQCRTEQSDLSKPDPSSYSWGNTTDIIIEKGFFHSKKSLDSAGNQLVGDTLLPIEIQGSKMIIEKMVPMEMEMKIIDGIEDFYITKIGYSRDTFEYEIKNIIGRTFLLLVSEKSSGQVFILKDKEINLPDTKNIKFPNYKIGGYAVGDEVIRNDIHVISSDQFGSTLTEEAILMDNENVYLKVIGSSYIEEIKWINIKDEEFEKLRKGINTEFNNQPAIEHLIDGTGNETEMITSYYWTENEVNILLSRTTEFGELDQSWTLTYTNLIVSNILRNYLDSDPESI